jgi:hypothetical protein
MSLRHYPYRMISGDALEVLIDVGKFNTISTNCIVKSLEAFCDLAGVSIERHTLFLPEFTEIAKGYLGALASDDFTAFLTRADASWLGAFNRCMRLYIRNHLPLNLDLAALTITTHT